MNSGNRSDEFKAGYDAAIADLKEKNKLELFKEGYMNGFRDGSMAMLMELKEKMPADLKEKMGGDVQPWIWPW